LLTVSGYPPRCGRMQRSPVARAVVADHGGKAGDVLISFAASSGPATASMTSTGRPGAPLADGQAAALTGSDGRGALTYCAVRT
jgi:hypothetical protein